MVVKLVPLSLVQGLWGAHRELWAPPPLSTPSSSFLSICTHNMWLFSLRFHLTKGFQGCKNDLKSIRLKEWRGAVWKDVLHGVIYSRREIGYSLNVPTVRERLSKWESVCWMKQYKPISCGDVQLGNIWGTNIDTMIKTVKWQLCWGRAWAEQGTVRSGASGQWASRKFLF